MSMNVKRTAQAVSFNTGISMAEYNEMPAGQTRGQTQGQILPGSTTVSEALSGVFPKDPTVAALILGQLANEGSSPTLRTSNGFYLATRKAIDGLLKRGTPVSNRAAVELTALLEDADLLDMYRASLLES
ncbi:MAG: hypothetical protein MJ109_05865 [Kiritimatiellae bacterium]|nr:hypothetical protein [Kiritimatiellia bacterium]